MTIPQYDKSKEYFDLKQAMQFWDFIKPKDDNEFVEIRLTGIHDVICKIGDTQYTISSNSIYKEISMFAKNNNMRVRKNCIFFVKTFDEVAKILSYRNGFFCFFTKVCYGVNNRWKEDDMLQPENSGYASVWQIQRLYLDIEDADHGTISNNTPLKNILKKYVYNIKDYLIDNYLMDNYIIVSSGSGYHLISKVDDININNEIKYKYKMFILKLHSRFQNKVIDWFEVDKLYDATRVSGLPGTYNRKREGYVTIVDVNYGEEFDLRKILSKIKLPKKKNTIKMRKTNLPKIEESLEWQILCKNDVPSGDRHNRLVFPLKMLIRDLDLQYEDYESVLEDIYDTIDLSEKGTEGKEYSRGIVINWIKDNWDWFNKHKDLVNLYEKLTNKSIEVVNDNSLKENDKIFE